MKELQKYRVIRAYGPYRVGDIIQPTGMLRDELRACGRIEKYEEPVAAVVPEPAPEPIDDISDDEPDDLLTATVEDAIQQTGELATLPRGRRGRYGR